MSESLASHASPLAPVGLGERVALIDAIRGFALFGVLVANFFTATSDAIVIAPARIAALPTSGIDAFVKVAIGFLITSKFVTIFSFLFGLGFSIQLLRADARGVPVVPLYLRRLGWLLAFGVVHSVFLWWGDVLRFYAVLGALLLPLRRRRERTLLIAGLLLTVILPIVMTSLPAFSSKAPRSQAPAGPRGARLDERVEHLARGDYRDVVFENLAMNREYFLGPQIVLFLVQIMGLFVLGFFVGRRGYLQDAPRHLALFRKALVWGLVLGIVGNLIFTSMIGLHRIPASPVWHFAGRVLAWAGIPALSLGYVAALVLLHQKPAWRRRIEGLAPVGRMALTNYLLQSVLYLVLLHNVGLGLLGSFGPAISVVASAVFFAAQIAFSRWWLRRYRFGPAEWLWRSLTYWRRQPMRLGDVPLG